MVCIVMEHKQELHIKELTNLKERFSRAAAAKVQPVIALKVAGCISHNRKLVLVFMHIISNTKSCNGGISSRMIQDLW